MTPDTAQAALLWARENPDAILRHAFALPTYADEIALRDAMWPIAHDESVLAWRVWGQDLVATRRCMDALPWFEEEGDDAAQ
jgi:hypothetical protein